jgi:predicted nucleic acid-binding Zn ribbon protein
MSVTRTYQCQRTGVVFDTVQLMTDGPLTACHHCGTDKCVPKQLISGGSEIHFRSGDTGGWASAGYSKNPNERRAEYALGRKLRKS